MLFSRHLNNMPVVSSLMCWSYTELIKKRMDQGSAFSLQLPYKSWSETVVLEFIVAIQNIESPYKT